MQHAHREPPEPLPASRQGTDFGETGRTELGLARPLLFDQPTTEAIRNLRVARRNKSHKIIVLISVQVVEEHMYRLLGTVLVFAGIGVFYLAASADPPAQNEPEALRRKIPKSPMRPETIEAAARGAWRAIPDTSQPAPAVAVTPAARTALPVARDTASPPADRMVMIRDLQRELKRVGCYEGDIHGGLD